MSGSVIKFSKKHTILWRINYLTESEELTSGISEYALPAKSAEIEEVTEVLEKVVETKDVIGATEDSVPENLTESE